jgi:hypothetical protein
MEKCLCPVIFASHETEVLIETLWFTGWFISPSQYPDNLESQWVTYLVWLLAFNLSHSS